MLPFRLRNASPSLRDASGFSLIEVVITLLLIAIVATIVTPRFFSSLAAHRVLAAADRVRADVERTGQRARIRSTGQSIRFNVAESTYVVSEESKNATQVVYAVDLSKSPYRAEILNADFEGGIVLEFDGFGRPLQSGAIVIQAGRQRQVVRLGALPAADGGFDVNGI